MAGGLHAARAVAQAMFLIWQVGYMLLEQSPTHSALRGLYIHEVSPHEVSPHEVSPHEVSPRYTDTRQPLLTPHSSLLTPHTSHYLLLTPHHPPPTTHHPPPTTYYLLLTTYYLLGLARPRDLHHPCRHLAADLSRDARDAVRRGERPFHIRHVAVRALSILGA